MTRQYAKQQLEKSEQLTNELQMSVYTLFQRDLITNETHMIRAMFSDAIEGDMWKNNKLNSLSSLNVPYALYLSDCLEQCSGELIFDEIDF